LKKRKEVAALVLALMIFLSMLCSLPWVFADYTVAHASFPPDLPGDLNADAVVDIKDVAIVSKAFGSVFGGVNWNPIADVNDDGKVDIKDMGTVSKKYGTTYDTSPTPIAYSTSFEFSVPNDGDSNVWYYILVRFYVPEGLSNKTFSLVAGKSVDDAIRNVKVDCKLMQQSQVGGVFNIPLGQLLKGYHLLELEYLESIGAGSINFSVQTSAGEYAWLDRFRIYVPNYSDNKYEYTVKTRTYFPGDTFFLGGYADDFIDDVYVDVGLIWQDWEWDMGSSYGAIYAWGDGFMYPLEWQYDWHNITFTFGEISQAGLLDFQYISWTNQKDKIGKPKFYAVGNLNQADCITIDSAMFYGGSKWKFEDDPEFSERYFEARQIINATYDDGDYWFTTSFEVGLGLGWAEWALLPATEDDVGITLNLTCRYWNSNKGMAYPYQFWTLDLRNITLDVYSFPALEIKGMEYQEHDSFVKSDGTAAIDYMGTVIMFVSSTIVGERRVYLEQLLG